MDTAKGDLKLSQKSSMKRPLINNMLRIPRNPGRLNDPDPHLISERLCCSDSLNPKLDPEVRLPVHSDVIGLEAASSFIHICSVTASYLR